MGYLTRPTPGSQAAPHTDTRTTRIARHDRQRPPATKPADSTEMVTDNRRDNMNMNMRSYAEPPQQCHPAAGVPYQPAGACYAPQPLLWHKRDPTANPRYKTALCSHFMSGSGCPFGATCVYAHGQQELRELSAKAKALRAEKQRQREGGHGATAGLPLRDIYSAPAAVFCDTPAGDPRPAVCSPLPNASSTGSSNLWAAPPAANLWAPARTAEPEPSAEESMQGDQLARMVSALLPEDEAVPAANPAADPPAEDAKKAQQLDWALKSLEAGMLTQAEFAAKMTQLMAASPVPAAKDVNAPAASSSVSDVFSSDSDDGADATFQTDGEAFEALAKSFERTVSVRQLARALSTRPGLPMMWRRGKTLLMLAAKAGRAGAVAALGERMQRSALDLKTKEITEPNPAGGYTALHYAAYDGQRGAVEALLKLGADPTILTAAGETAARTAANRKHSAVAGLLKSAAKGKKDTERRERKMLTATNPPPSAAHAAPIWLTSKPPAVSKSVAHGPSGPGFKSLRTALPKQRAASSRSKWSGGSDFGADFGRARNGGVH